MQQFSNSKIWIIYLCYLFDSFLHQSKAAIFYLRNNNSSLFVPHRLWPSLTEKNFVCKFSSACFRVILVILTQMHISPTDLDFSVSFANFFVHIYRTFIPFWCSLSPSRRQFLNSRQNNGDATSTVTRNLWKIKASRVQFIGENTVVVASWNKKKTHYVTYFMPHSVRSRFTVSLVHISSLLKGHEQFITLNV